MNMKHSTACAMSFGRYDKSGACLRCNELAAGAPARKSWHARYYAEQAQRTAAVHAHDFTACARVNVCCTHFDY
jgi:hypothetical protein